MLHIRLIDEIMAHETSNFGTRQVMLTENFNTHPLGQMKEAALKDIFCRKITKCVVNFIHFDYCAKGNIPTAVIL